MPAILVSEIAVAKNSLVTSDSLLLSTRRGHLDIGSRDRSQVEHNSETFVRPRGDPESYPKVQITFLEYVGFRTKGTSSESIFDLPVHPAYAYPSTTSSWSRAQVKEGKWIGDADKAVRMLYSKLLSDPNPPLRLPLGHDVIPKLLDQRKNGIRDLEERTSWSDGLVVDGKSWQIP